jgi:hypothetical protein
VLDFGDRMNSEVRGAAEDIQKGLGYKDMDLVLTQNMHRGFTDEIEGMIDNAKDNWIKEHGPISSGRHPADDHPVARRLAEEDD